MEKTPALFGKIITSSQDFFEYHSLKPAITQRATAFPSNLLAKHPIFKAFFPENPLKTDDFSSLSADELKVEFFFLLEELFNRKLGEIVAKPQENSIFEAPETVVFLNELISMNLFALKQDLRIENNVKMLIFLLIFQQKNQSIAKFIDFFDLILLLVLGIIRYYSTIPDIFQRNEAIIHENSLYMVDKFGGKFAYVEDLAIYALKKNFFNAKNLQFQEKSLNYLYFFIENSRGRAEKSKNYEVFMRNLKRILGVLLRILKETEEKTLFSCVISSEESQENSFFSFALQKTGEIFSNFSSLSTESKQVFEKNLIKSLQV